jgi:hypothetical protein
LETGRVIKEALSIPGQARVFPLLQEIQTGSEVQPASYAIRPGDYFPKGKEAEV